MHRPFFDGLARKIFSADELFREASDIIAESRKLTQWMMKEGFIAEAPEV